MRALLGQGTLNAPTLGWFTPSVSAGAHVSEGTPLGTLERLGRRTAVLAPAGAHGQVLDAHAGYVQYGDPLVGLGEAALVDAPTVVATQAGGEALRAPMAGIVYLRPASGEAAFTEVGAQIRRNATVALVEVMKTFTPLKAAADGVVRAVAVQDGDAVEAGDPILRARHLRHEVLSGHGHRRPL